VTDHKKKIEEEKKILAKEDAEQNKTLNQILRSYGVTYTGSDYKKGQLPPHYSRDGHVAPDQQ